MIINYNSESRSWGTEDPSVRNTKERKKTKQNKKQQAAEAIPDISRKSSYQNKKKMLDAVKKKTKKNTS